MSSVAPSTPAQLKIEDYVAASPTLCQARGCGVTSTDSTLGASSLRMGFPGCMDNHMDRCGELRKRLGRLDARGMDPIEHCTFIFYHLGNDLDQQYGCLKQLVASIPDEQLPMELQAFQASSSSSSSAAGQVTQEAQQTQAHRRLQAFVSWCRQAHSARSSSGAAGAAEAASSDSDACIVLVAHSAAQWAHEVLIQAMIDEGMQPPGFRLADAALLLHLLHPWRPSNLKALLERYCDDVPDAQVTTHKGKVQVVQHAVMQQGVVLAGCQLGWQQLLYATSTGMRSYRRRAGLEGQPRPRPDPLEDLDPVVKQLVEQVMADKRKRAKVKEEENPVSRKLEFSG